MRAALLGFLSGFAEEAVFIRVLAAVLGDAAAVERTEDGVGAIVFREVVLVFGEFGLVVVELASGGVELGFGVGDGFRFGAVGMGVRKDAVFD